MLKALVEASLRFRGVVIALACVLLAYGVFIASRAKLDIFPEFASPTVVIQTEAPGLSPEQVEQLVTRPIETALNGVAGLDSIRSQSIQGLSVVTAVFADGADVFRARQMASERLVEAASQMPQGVSAPLMAPLTSTASTLLSIGLTSEKRTPRDVRTFADWKLRPAILSVPGVAKASVYGGEVRDLEVQVIPEKLGAHGLSLQDVVEATKLATGVRGAGFVETPQQRIVVRTDGQSLTAGALGEAIVARANGRTLRLKDVANVVEGAEPRFGEGAIDGTKGVILVLSSQFGANTLDVTRDVERLLDEMKPALDAEKITLHPRLFRPATFIEQSISNVEQSLLIGAVLVAVVLFVFLQDLRTAFISLTAIPLSLLAAVIVLDRFGATINTLTLGGLAIAIGEVVDDAIIDVENIFRRLRENRARTEPRPALDVALDASLEVRGAVVWATVVVALVFLPVLAMSGVQGRLFAPLGIAYVLAVLASLVVALTVTPALSLVLLPGSALEHREPRLVVWLKGRYGRLLDSLMMRPRAVVAVAATMCVAAAATIPLMGGEFLPEFKEGNLIVHVGCTPGTSIDEAMRLGSLVSRSLLEDKRIAQVSQQCGRAEAGDDTTGPHLSEMVVRLAPMSGEEMEQMPQAIRDRLLAFPGMTFSVQTFLTERIEETVSGATSAFLVRLTGDDLDLLEDRARDVQRIIEGIPGATDVACDAPPGETDLVVRLLPAKLAQHGLAPVTALEAVQTAYQGANVAQTYEGNKTTEVRVLLDEKRRADPESVAALELRTPEGGLVRLDEVARIELETGRYAVLHEATRRRIAVTCNVEGRDTASFAAEARAKIRAKLAGDKAVIPVFGGAAEASAKARRELLLHSLVAGVGIVLVLWVAVGRARRLALVLANLPFALVGGVLAVFAGGGGLSVGSLVGFVTLFGITTRNSLMLVSHWDHLVRVEGEAWGPIAAMRGASERLVPVLMTALVTALGLLPIAIGTGEAGREIEGPMALVILGGLLTSTALNLLVLPVLALRWGRFEKDPDGAGA